MVSTDDLEIAEIAKKYGASVPFVREHYADDDSPISLATINTLQRLKNDLGKEYHKVVQLMANCPLRTFLDIQKAMLYFNAHQLSSQISCFKYGWMNPWWASTLDAENRPTSLFPAVKGKRSQDLKDLYCPTGAIWIAEVDSLMDEGSFYTKDHVFYPIDWVSAVDIDDYDDLKMAQVLFKMRANPQEIL